MHQHGVAVGRRAGRCGDAGDAAGAGAIFEHDWLSELLGQLVEHDAGDDVVGVAGGERNDRGDGAARPGLREGLMCCCCR